MNSTDLINRKIQMLPPASQRQVLDLIDRLLEKPIELTPEERIAAFKELVERHKDNRVVILNDSREAIYED